MNKFIVKTIDFQLSDAHLQLVKSLKETGFAVIRNHGINKELIESIYEEWSSFFKSDNKYNYLL